MHPDHDEKRWRTPQEQASKAPYESSSENHPIVTMTPDSASVGADMHEDSPEKQERGPQGADQAVHWQATEYIHRHKSPLWFIIFFAATAGLMFWAFWFGEYIFATLVLVMAAALFVYTRRPPRVIGYTLTEKGLYVDDRLYTFSQFKGFGVIHDEGEFSIMLIPTKRFQPGVMVYFPEDAGEAIVDMLGSRLPMRKLHLDIIDRIIRQLRI